MYCFLFDNSLISHTRKPNRQFKSYVRRLDYSKYLKKDNTQLFAHYTDFKVNLVDDCLRLCEKDSERCKAITFIKIEVEYDTR